MGIPALPDIINAVIMTSALSNGIANCFSASRSLYALALSGNAPAILKTTARGVPIYCVTVVCTVGALCFLSVSNSSATVFTWITNLTGSGNLLLFGLFHVIYIRWYHGMRAQGHDRNDLPYRIRGQLAMSYIALIGYFVILLVSAAYPNIR
jgi:amino acid transporter